MMLFYIFLGTILMLSQCLEAWRCLFWTSVVTMFYQSFNFRSTFDTLDHLGIEAYVGGSSVSCDLSETTCR